MSQVPSSARHVACRGWMNIAIFERRPYVLRLYRYFDLLG